MVAKDACLIRDWLCCSSGSNGGLRTRNMHGPGSDDVIGKSARTWFRALATMSMPYFCVQPLYVSLHIIHIYIHMYMQIYE